MRFEILKAKDAIWWSNAVSRAETESRPYVSKTIITDSSI